MRVVILGCGPAGLLAAHAAAEEGAEPVILSRKQKSPMRGAQYLHSQIPGMPAHEFKVSYGLVGTVAGYRDKVYGARSAVAVSPEQFGGVGRAWDIRAVYEALWASYGPSVIEWEATPENLLAVGLVYDADLIVSTVPAYLLCKGGCRFDSAPVLVAEVADGPILNGHDNAVICSGMAEDLWYRQSRICGWENTEYPYRDQAEVRRRRSNVARVVKPLSTDCECFPEVRRMGRYGRWQKGVLSDSAYIEMKGLVRGA